MNPADVLAALEPIGPSRLLDHFLASRRERAETIRRFWSKPNERCLAENLISLEIDDQARAVVISLLREQEGADI